MSKWTKGWLRGLLALAVGWCVLVEVVEVVADVVFGMRLDGDWFLLIAASSGAELVEFVRVYDKELTLAVVAVVVLWALVGGFMFFARRKVWYCGLAAVAVYVGIRLAGCGLTWPPLYLAYDTVRGYGQYAELIAAGSCPSIQARAAVPADAGIVVVIGESMTTDRMSLYGYAKKTTPCLDALRDKMTVMGPVRPNYPDTVRSIRMMFTRATAEHPEKAIETAAVAFRKRGYRPVFIGGQPKWGRYCGVEHLVFAACETRTYANEGRVTPDEDLIGYLQRELSVDSDRPFLIFVQLNGSHFPPEQRTPEVFETPADFDAYDRSIAYTDSILGEIVRILPPKTTLVYVSDHGESPDSPSWRDSNAPSMWRVPVLVYPKNDRLTPVKTLDQVFDLLEQVSRG